MNAYQPLAAALFFYECLRLLMLVTFQIIEPPGGFISGILPVYLSSNAMFPLMALFLWLKPEEYRGFIALYMAGKWIAVISFFSWQIFSSRELLWVENAARSMILLGGYTLINFADIFTVWGAWKMKNKYRGGT